MNKIITVHYSCMDSLKEGITEKANVWGGWEFNNCREISVFAGIVKPVILSGRDVHDLQYLSFYSRALALEVTIEGKKDKPCSPGRYTQWREC